MPKFFGRRSNNGFVGPFGSFFGCFAFSEKFVNYLKFFSQSISFFKIFDPFFLRTKVFDNNFGLLGVVPKIGGKGLFLFVGNFYKFGINVKDTSSTHQGVLQYLLFVR